MQVDAGRRSWRARTKQRPMARTVTLQWNRAATISLGGVLAGAALGGCLYAADAPSDVIAGALERVPEIRAASASGVESGIASASREQADAASSPSPARADGRWSLRG